MSSANVHAQACNVSVACDQPAHMKDARPRLILVYARVPARFREQRSRFALRRHPLRGTRTGRPRDELPRDRAVDVPGAQEPRSPRRHADGAHSPDVRSCQTHHRRAPRALQGPTYTPARLSRTAAHPCTRLTPAWRRGCPPGSPRAHSPVGGTRARPGARAACPTRSTSALAR